MVSAREGSRVLRALSQRPSALKGSINCSRKFASSQVAASTPPKKLSGLEDVESNSSFATPTPDANTIEAFEQGQASRTRESRLPGNRYQYHPPKYNRGPLHPVQSPPSSDPAARDFVPGPFNFPRIKHTYDSTFAPDLATLTYQHVPPGTPASESQKGLLRGWDGSSPYHKNRPLRGPRGGSSSKLGLVERDITWYEIPEIQAVTINSYAPLSSTNKEYLHVARAVVQAISGSFPETTTVKKHVVQWGVRKGDKAGAKTTLRGAAALEFVDKLVTLVLPKIKDWQGLQASTGDRSGNIAFGLKPEWMSFFPELEANYDMYPVKLMPGCNIFIQTTGTSDRHGRLLLQALGFPFHGKITY